MRIVCVSDTHLKHDEITLPDGDVLIHAGDSTSRGRAHEIDAVNTWFGKQKHKNKILIAGNHDFGFEQDVFARNQIIHAHYLEDEELIIDGVKFWGSPWQPRFFNWAFNLERGAPLRKKWDLIPKDTNVLITHGPPFGILDMTDRGEPVGCEALRPKVLELEHLKLHVFGHIHESYGVHDNGYTKFVNASICTLRYQATNLPIVIDLD